MCALCERTQILMYTKDKNNKIYLYCFQHWIIGLWEGSDFNELHMVQMKRREENTIQTGYHCSIIKELESSVVPPCSSFIIVCWFYPSCSWVCQVKMQEMIQGLEYLSMTYPNHNLYFSKYTWRSDSNMYVWLWNDHVMASIIQCSVWFRLYGNIKILSKSNVILQWFQ